MPSVQLTLAEREIVKVVLEFLETRGLHISQLSLERETGLINGMYSDDALFLRQLILDGQWDNALDFVEPLRNLPDFDSRQFRYLITKYKYFELLCIKQEPGPMQDNDFTVEELVECLKDLEHISPSPEDYRHLCALVTLPRLSDHADFKNWNPSSARVECFTKVYPLVTKFLPPPGNMSGSMQALDNVSGHASNDRLLQLAAKGLFYEACVDYCQGQAVRDKSVQGGPKLSKLLDCRTKLSSTDLSLVSWLETLSLDQFSLPFEQKTLDLKVESLKKPKLEAQWTEQILATPIKPGGQFPHAAVPSAKLKSAEKMSRSLVLPSIASSMTASGFVHHRPTQHVMSQSSAAVVGFSIRPSPPSQMQQTAQMQQSQMDALFETSDLTRSTRPELPPAASAAGIQQPLVHPNTLFDATPRQQLEELARRSLPPSAQRQTALLPTVPEGDTPTENIMEGSRLFQEFATRQQRHSSQPLVDAVTYQMMQMSTIGQQPTQSVYGSPQALRPSSMPSQSMPMLQAMSQPPAADYAPRRLQYPLGQQNSLNGMASGGVDRNVQFSAIARIEDSQAIRAVAFHPSGRYFAVGTNSKQMHVLKYPDIRKIIPGDSPRAAEVLLSRPKQHRGSVYCVGFNPTGELLATGSNDKTIRLMGFNADSCKIGAEVELTMHDGTVRDLVFMEDTVSRTSLLISGGAGNCHIHLTDCATGQTFKSLAGHTAPILGLYTWGGCMFVSCSQDKTIRFWDLRCAQAVNLIAPGSKTASAPVTSVCVDPGGKLLVSGHEDASVMLYDVTGSKVVQIFRPHGDEVRTVRFSPGTYYLLSGSYDKKIAITDMRGDLMAPLMYLPVAEHNDKVIQCRWHPHDFSFLSTSADRTATLWALPPPAV